jgi:glutamyl/glutaminyl-tRNA synthetase
VWEDIRVLVREGEFDYFFTAPRLEATKIPGKGSNASAAITHLEHVRDTVTSLSTQDFEDAERIKNAVWEYATKEGRGAVLWPLRYSLTGKERSPDPFAICMIIGKNATLERIENARNILKES